MKQISLSKVLCAGMLCAYLLAVLIARQIADYTYVYYKGVFIIIWLLIAAFMTCVFIRSKGAFSRAFSAEAAATKRECVIWFAVTALLALFAIAVYYIVFFPGTFSPDSLSQLKQARTGVYSDWHPFIHTLLFFTLPMKLLGGSGGYIVLLQIMWFSLALGYLNYSLRKTAAHA